MDQILALWLGNQRLQLGCRESIHETSLGNHQEQDLGASQDGKLVGLHNESVNCREDGDAHARCGRVVVPADLPSS